MYITQTDFFGKTGPINPCRTINENSPAIERQYPNRWMEDRNLRRLNKTAYSFSKTPQQEFYQDNSSTLNVGNKRYIQILNQFVKDEYVWKLLKWANSISEQHKKGLRVLKAVIDIKGQKKFKDSANKGVVTDTSSIRSFNVNDLAFDVQDAKDKFRKRQNQSSYRQSFGEPPKAAEDFQVIKQKKFRELSIARYIKPDAAAYIEKWLGLGNQDQFVKRVYFTIREIHTIIKNQEAPTANNNLFYKGRQAERAPRFDQILTNATELERAKSSQANIRTEQKVRYAYLEDLMKKTKVNKVFEPLIDTKKMKQQFMRGQVYNITDYVELKQPLKTSYQETMHGKHHEDKAKIVDFEHLSCNMAVIPDPRTLNHNEKRITAFSKDLKKMTMRNFSHTGKSWNRGNEGW